MSKNPDYDRFVESTLEPLDRFTKERLYRLGAARSILWLMRGTWDNHGEPGEPFTEIAACEIAINELIDHARNRGCTVTFDNVEIGSPYGVGVHAPEATP